VTDTAARTPLGSTAPLDVLREVERRVLWLSTAIVDHANRVRPDRCGLKVGGHQASSASMVSIMTALWFHALATEICRCVSPRHMASPLHRAAPGRASRRHAPGRGGEGRGETRA
jgi:pyruvate dehydrogenase E1 component